MASDAKDPPTLLLTADQAAKALAISPRALWTLTKCGEVPSIRLGRSVRYSVDQLREWIGGQSATDVAQQRGKEVG